MMTDGLTPEERSRLMSRIRGKDTKPEMIVRRLAWSLGVRYRLHRRDLPGCPDMVFAIRRKVIFIHGCFWHRHEGCQANRIPKSHVEFWTDKLEKNRLRDMDNQAKLRAMGWDALVVWECETKDRDALRSRIKSFLEDGK
jgi:DNA mismatch endonuclease (patch repair protein)